MPGTAMPPELLVLIADVYQWCDIKCDQMQAGTARLQHATSPTQRSDGRFPYVTRG